MKLIYPLSHGFSYFSDINMFLFMFIALSKLQMSLDFQLLLVYFIF